ncbi:1-acyl-sn-glycerol-3-phosphate acyltransferase [Candidatus Woesearchaeota archaeon]|nr:1-acyl-sn-glycerol-3-phosphate acyltransferase [Candidatus Woesearchaeota archaeon]
MVFAILKILLGIPLKVIWIRKIDGIQNLPKNEQFVLASNHISMLDGVMLSAVVALHIKKKLHFYVKSDYFNNRFFKYFLDLTECIPVYIKENRNPKLNKAAFNRATEYLKKREPVGIFPEGGISFDGKLGKPKPGLARLVNSTKAKVLPVAILCKNGILGSKKICAGIRGYEIKIGKLIDFKNKYNDINYISDHVMKKISLLLQEND